MTEVDSANWVANTATHNGGFWVGFASPTSTISFVLNQTGKYYYVCQPHASMGMKGVIYVDFASSVKDVSKSDDFSAAYLGNGNLKLNYYNADEIAVYNSLGQNVFTSSLAANANSEMVKVSLLTGTYFKKSGRSLITKKVFVN